MLSQYDLLGNSTFATEANQIMLVVDKNTTLTDFTLAQMGFYDHDEFINIGQKAVEYNDFTNKYNNKEITKEEYDEALKMLDAKYPYRRIFNYTDLIGSELYYFPHSTMWKYGNVSPETSMEGSLLLSNTSGEILYFQYSHNTTFGDFDLLTGIHIVPGQSVDLNDTVLYARKASASRDPETFFDTNDLDPSSFWIYVDYSKITTLDPAQIFDPTRVLRVSGNTAQLMHNGTPTSLFTNVVKDVHETGLVEGYHYPAVADPSWINENKGMKMTVSGILRAKETTNFGCLSRGVYYSPALAEKYMNDANASNSEIVNNPTHGIKSLFTSGQASNTRYKAYVTYSYLDYTKDAEGIREIKDGGYANAINGEGGVSSLISIGGSDNLSKNEAAMRRLCGLKAHTDNELYVFDKYPDSMDIYPRDFANKEKITKYLDRWNSDDVLLINGKEVKRSERVDLSYTDTVEVIITMINSLITIVTSALVAFTSLSLVVSCFMIAVITYISVVERVKEIGVIRSLGGRKKDVSRLFTAENLMTGLFSGVIGIVVTYLLSLLINFIVHFFGAPAIASLPWWIALIMIGISIALNVISGFIPSRNAARQDPVEALRSE